MAYIKRFENAADDEYAFSVEGFTVVARSEDHFSVLASSKLKFYPRAARLKPNFRSPELVTDIFFRWEFRMRPNQAAFPSSQRRGSCAINKCRGATKAAQTGWSDRNGRVSPS